MARKKPLTRIPTPKRQPPAKDTGNAAALTGADAGPDLSHIAPQLRHMAVPIADLAFLADNPMEHSADAIEEMRERLQRRGQLQPLIVNRRKTPPVVVGGNKRLAALLAENYTHAAVLDVDLADDDEAALAIELNATQDVTWHRERLQAALHRVGKLTLGERADALFARLAEAQKLIPPLGAAGTPPPEDPGPQIDRAAELQKKWGTATGQLWEIESKATPGKCHRLLCGDSTKAEDVGRVMGGEEPAAVITDPPYGISYQNRRGDIRPDAHFDPELSGDESSDVGQAVVDSCFARGWPTCAFAHHRAPWSGEWRQWLVWDKGPAVGGGGDPQTCWKFTWELIQVGGFGNLNGQRDSAVLVYHVGQASFSHHPTEKPPALLRYLTEKLTIEGDIIADLFAGSGSQFIAAEQTGRICYGVEISDKYCAVILERLEQLGLHPRLAAPLESAA